MKQGVPIYVLKRKDEKKRNIPAKAVFSILEFLRQEQKKGIELIASCEVENRRASLATNPLRVFSAGLLFNSLTPLTRQVFFGVKVKSTTTVNYKNTPVKHFKRP